MYPYNLYNNELKNINITANIDSKENKNLKINTDPDQDINNINKNLDQDQKIININQKIIQMLLMAMKNELEDKNYYNALSKKINNKQDAEIINQIGLDEQKHYKYLYDIYKKIISSWDNSNYDLDQENLLINLEKDLNDPELNNNILEDFTNSMLDELDTVEFYRRLLFLFLDLQIRDMLYEIITDEQAHAIKFSYLFSKYNYPQA